MKRRRNCAMKLTAEKKVVNLSVNFFKIPNFGKVKILSYRLQAILQSQPLIRITTFLSAVNALRQLLYQDDAYA
jgi:hypothetical protein